MAVLGPARPGEGSLLDRGNGFFSAELAAAVERDPVRLTARIVEMAHRGLGARVLSALERWDGIGSCDDTIVHPLRAIADLYAALSDAQRRAGVAALGKIGRAGIRAALLKSYDLLAYSSANARLDVRYDIDVLIRPEEYVHARELLEADGWMQGDIADGRIVPLTEDAIRDHDLGHYEWWPFLKEGPEVTLPDAAVPFASMAWPFAPGSMCGNRVRTVVALDLHHSIDAAIPADVVWGHTHAIDASTKALTPEATVWFLSGRVYHETMVHAARKFRLLSQLLGIFGGPHPINWQTVVELANEHRMQPAVYYTLSTIRRVWGIGANQPVIESIGTTFYDQHHLRDFGDLIPALLDLDREEELCLASNASSH